MESRAVLVANLSSESKQHEIVKIFSRCGKILMIKVYKAKQQSSCDLELIFSTITAARMALKLNGRPLLVKALVDYAPNYVHNTNSIFYKAKY